MALNNGFGLLVPEYYGVSLTTFGVDCNEPRVDGKGIPDRDSRLFTDLLLESAVANFAEATAGATEDKPVFFDRGIPDVACYAELFGFDIEKYLLPARRFRHHSVVFLAPPWEEIYEHDDERKMPFAMARKWNATFERVYTELQYKIVMLPTGVSVEERASLILSEIGLKRVYPRSLTMPF